MLGSKIYYGNPRASYRTISVTSKRLLETQLFEEKTSFQRKNYLGRLFLVLSSMKNLQEQFIEVHQVLSQLFCKLLDHFVSTYEVHENNFSKRAYFADEKQFWLIFFSFNRKWQTSGNILLGTTRYYGNHRASYKTIFVTPKRLLKTQLYEKKTIFQRKNLFGRFFLVLSSMKNLMEHFIEVHQVLSQLFCKF